MQNKSKTFLERETNSSLMLNSTIKAIQSQIFPAPHLPTNPCHCSEEFLSKRLTIEASF